MEKQNTQTTSSDNYENQSSSSSKKRFFIVLTIVAILAGLGITYSFIKDSNDEEQLAYEILDGNINPDDYRTFLEKYPESTYSNDVKDRLSKLEVMLQNWDNIALSDNVNEFIKFKNKYTDPHFSRLCDIKIDSLDFIEAQRIGTEEAFQIYLDRHSDGRYSSEASIAQGKLHDQEIDMKTKESIVRIINDFFAGFEQQDETLITSNIASTMQQFLHKKNATKADVINSIKSMYNEHITGCQFIINRDMNLSRETGANGEPQYKATFTLDQHIERNNSGKTFGSYSCVVILNGNLLIESITMDEISKQASEQEATNQE